MIRVIALSVLAVSLLFVVNCGSKKVPKDLNDEQLYEAAMEELSSKSRGFPWVFTGRDYETIFKMLKEVQLRYTYSP